MKAITTPARQGGALVSVEYAVLIIVGALSAITLGLLFAGHLAEIWMGWLFGVHDTAEGMYNDMLASACFQHAEATNPTDADGFGLGNITLLPVAEPPPFPQVDGAVCSENGDSLVDFRVILGS